ncbi:MAG: preprotein translocase subunit SecE [Candidatus Firestonebacteria bacterium]|nr:preprotein translocase subunit SecE [Candidatus Firestonebacteria bacterium]
MNENIEKLKKYFEEVKIEVRNVTWPTKKEIINLTIIVVALSVALALFLGVVDKSFIELIIRVLR